MAIPYPNFDPEIVRIGPVAIRWYAAAYLAGLVIGWRYCLRLAKKPPHVARPVDIDDFLLWATAGVVLGGRIGYVLFYNPKLYLGDPLEILRVWHGGMSFHGGAAGVIIAIVLFTRMRNISFLAMGDIVCCAVPIGLFFGRIANFVNGELWGRTTDVWWAMVFPSDRDQLPRHPSQLYEAFLEGIVLFGVLWLLQRFAGARHRPGMISGAFLMGYGIARIIVEFFRQPDAQLGYLVGDASLGITMGQILSLPLLVVGLWLILRAKPIPAPA